MLIFLLVIISSIFGPISYALANNDWEIRGHQRLLSSFIYNTEGDYQESPAFSQSLFNTRVVGLLNKNSLMIEVAYELFIGNNYNPLLTPVDNKFKYRIIDINPNLFEVKKK